MGKKGKYKSGNLNREERNSNALSQLKQGRRHILFLSETKFQLLEHGGHKIKIQNAVLNFLFTVRKPIVGQIV